MANTITDLVPDLYAALDIVSRELTGFIPACRIDTSLERAGLNDTIRIPVTANQASVVNTPGTTAPAQVDNTISNVTISINKSKHVPVGWSGEESRSLARNGIFPSIAAQRFYQGMRTLVNEMETDLWTAAYQGASRTAGSAASPATPFSSATDLGGFADVLQILEENGAPRGDLQYVLSHGAVSNIRSVMTSLWKVNEAGSSDLLRNGMTDRVMGFALRHSDAIVNHTNGTGASYLLSAQGEIGDTSIAVDTGTGTILAGDNVTFAGTTDQIYVVNTGIAAPGTFIIGSPGLKDVEANNDAVTVGADYFPLVAFDRNALVLINRPPAMPQGGDMADDMMTLVDDRTGLVFEVAVYRQFLQTQWHVRAAWGAGAVKSDHIANFASAG